MARQLDGNSIRNETKQLVAALLCLPIEEIPDGWNKMAKLVTGRRKCSMRATVQILDALRVENHLPPAVLYWFNSTIWKPNPFLPKSKHPTTRSGSLLTH